MAIAVKAIDECRLLSNIQSAFGNMPVSLDQTSIQMVPSHTLPIVFRGEGHKIPRGPIIPCVPRCRAHVGSIRDAAACSGGAAADPVRIKATVMAIPYNHAPADQVWCGHFSLPRRKKRCR